MDKTKTIILVIGLTAVLIGLFADALGIGAEPTIGWKQILAILVGTIILAAGYFVGNKN